MLVVQSIVMWLGNDGLAIEKKTEMCNKSLTSFLYWENKRFSTKEIVKNKVHKDLWDCSGLNIAVNKVCLQLGNGAVMLRTQAVEAA